MRAHIFALLLAAASIAAAAAGCTEDNLAGLPDGLTVPPAIDGGDDASSTALPDLAPTADLLVIDFATRPTPSCPAAGRGCGPRNADDCCASLPVPGGTFNRSNDAKYPATVSTFRLDTYEVTVGRFRAFVSAGKGTQKAPPAVGAGAGVAPGSGWDPRWNANLPGDAGDLLARLKCDPARTWTDAPGTNEAMPINCLDWYVAFAFCAWDEGRLPTEAEWNYAAAGGAEQRPYPWSTGQGDFSIDSTKATYGRTPISGVGAHAPAGDGRWGHADLAGNVWEWVLDGFADPYAINPCADCADLTFTSGWKVFRGGGFDDSAGGLLTTNRQKFAATSRLNFVGLRCARAP